MRIAINASTNEKDLRQYLRDLKQTVRLGKLAERALLKIQNDETYNGRVLVMRKHSRFYRNVMELQIKPERETPREAAPDFRDWMPQIGQFRMSHHGGSSFRAAEIFLQGTIWNKDGQLVQDQVFVGTIRYKKNGYSVVPVGKSAATWSREQVITLYQNYKAPNGRASLQSIGSMLANAITQGINDQFFNTMRYKVADWVVKEGVAEDFAQNLMKLAKVAEVMVDE